MSAIRYDVVIPTIGRASLGDLLASLAAATGPLPHAIVLVDDRSDASDGGLLLRAMIPTVLRARTRIVRSGGRGPAAARNAGWRSATSDWIAFLDDDVIVSPSWRDDLVADLARLPQTYAGSQARIAVPLPSDRRPTDWERNVAGLAHSWWITADMAYRRDVLAAVGGFDERFRRAYREDADLALRVQGLGYELARGRRRTNHPVRSADPWISVRLQRGNADDVLMGALHGRDWRERAFAPRGAWPLHLLTAGLAAGWLVMTARFAWSRIALGPRTPGEIATMVATSVAIPFAATAHRLGALARAPFSRNRRGIGRPDAVLFDRDGTLIVDVPYNGDPERVRLMPGARRALERLRAARIPVAVVSNQSGIARGLVSREAVDAVNARVEELLGPLDGWFVCPHDDADACTCRKPRPGLVLQAAQSLGADPSRVVMIGDIGADIEAARAAGAHAILVPTPVTRSEEVAAAEVVARDLESAVACALEVLA